MSNSISKATRSALKQTKAIKKHLRSVKRETREALEILKKVNLQLENQIKVDEVFRLTETFLTMESDEEFNRARDTYRLARKHLHECWELQKELKAKMDDVVSDMRSGNVSDENLDLHYTTARDLHFLLGEEMNYLNLASTTGVLFLDQIKRVEGLNDVPDSNTTIQ